MSKFDPIEKIKAKEYLKKNGWKDLIEVGERVLAESIKNKDLLQEKFDKACEKSIKSHAEKLSENVD